MNQRRTEWLQKADMAYNERQFKEPYRSTVAFCNWLENLGYLDKNSAFHILDLAAGQGANIYYMSRRYPECTFTGIDINELLVEKGNQFFADQGINNCHLEVGDLYDLDTIHKGKYDAVISFQTLSWLPEYRKPLAAKFYLEPKWIALSSLFFEGLVSSTIEVQLYSDVSTIYKESYYNVYSLPLIEEFFADHGYEDFKYIPFEIDIDLPEPEDKSMGTHTKKLVSGERIQLSGPLLMPWYFVSARKKV